MPTEPTAEARREAALIFIENDYCIRHPGQFCDEHTEIAAIIQARMDADAAYQAAVQALSIENGSRVRAEAEVAALLAVVRRVPEWTRTRGNLDVCTFCQALADLGHGTRHKPDCPRLTHPEWFKEKA